MASPQRRWQAACPACGAAVEFASAASSSAVCGYCRSTLLREGEALRKIGQSAELFEDYSPLRLGASGRHAGAAFSVIGRLQLAYELGSWNEWHLLFDSAEGGGGRSAWLAEDNGAFVLSFETALTEAVPAPDSLPIGSQQVLAGQGWQVGAKQRVRIAAAEGELPHAPPALTQQQTEFWVLELRNSQGEVASLEYTDPAAAPQFSIGRSVALAELAMSGLREDASSKTLAARTLPCPSCGATLAPRLAHSKSIVCGQCQAVVDIAQGAGADLGHFAQSGSGVEPALPLGSSGALAIKAGDKALPWQVVGFMVRRELPSDADAEAGSPWREYLLFNQLEGFAFLVDGEDGWSLVRPITGAPQSALDGIKVWQGKRFQLRWSYQAEVLHVRGEFYWQIRRHDRAGLSDYGWTSGGRRELLSCERTGTEISWSHGRALDAQELRRGFAQLTGSASALTPPRDVATYAEGGGPLLRSIAVGLFLVALMFALLRGCASDDCQAYKDSFGESSAEYRQCRQSSSGSGVRVGGGGGSYGGYRSGGGGHK